jgi:4-hydroxy-4-methyl-2-oxoglutarate aldolase
MSTHIGFRSFANVPRLPADAIARLAAYAPPDLSDAMHGSYTLDPAIRPLYPFATRVAGPAVTVCAPQGAFNIIKVAMEQTRPGDVLVINACRITAFAVWGGNVSKGMQHRGAAAAVIDGAARDPDEAQAVGFPVFARAQATGTPLLDGPGEVNVPVACGGVVVRPGDVIVADASGIVAVPQDAVEWVLQQVAALKARHAAAQPVLERGEVTGIQAILDALRQRGFAVGEDGGGDAG